MRWWNDIFFVFLTNKRRCVGDIGVPLFYGRTGLTLWGLMRSLFVSVTGGLIASITMGRSLYPQSNRDTEELKGRPWKKYFISRFFYMVSFIRVSCFKSFLMPIHTSFVDMKSSLSSIFIIHVSKCIHVSCWKSFFHIQACCIRKSVVARLYCTYLVLYL